MSFTFLKSLEYIKILYFYRVRILFCPESIFDIDDILVLRKIIVKNSTSSKDNIMFSAVNFYP